MLYPKRSFVRGLAVGLLLLGLMPGAYASLPTGQCALTTSGALDGPLCSVADTSHAISPDKLITGTTGYDAVRSDPGSGTTPIDAWNFCRYIDNISPQHHSLFIPMRTAAEWQAFFTNYPQTELALTHCALPWSVNKAPQTTTALPPYPSALSPDCATSASVANPNLYGRTGSDVWTEPGPAPSITCHSNTSVQSVLQWLAGDSEPSGSRISGTLTWTQAFTFSPDLLLRASDTTDPANNGYTIKVLQNTPVTLTWLTGQTAKVCTAAGAWSGNKAVGSGSVTFTPTDSGVYTLSCANAGGLTSTATVTINVEALGVCGADSGQTLASTPTNLCVAGDTASPLTANMTGWSWSCTPVDGGEAAACSATLQVAQCGTATVDGNGNLTAGSFCTAGTASAVTMPAGTYTCTTGQGAPTNTANCTATVKQTTTQFYCMAYWNSFGCKNLTTGQCYAGTMGPTNNAIPFLSYTLGVPAAQITYVSGGWSGWSCNCGVCGNVPEYYNVTK